MKLYQRTPLSDRQSVLHSPPWSQETPPLKKPGAGGTRALSSRRGKLLPLPSTSMKRVEDLIRRVASSGAPVTLLGESGVGKEGLARLVHGASGRCGDFVALNSATLRPELACSELFGHLKGAFTGALSSQSGAFRAADEGTLFLDEIAELSLEVQARLLRTLEEGEVRPVGSAQPTAVDVRLVTATHHNLSAAVRDGRFREDLFHRIYVLPIRIPPLRDRPEDIIALTRNFLEELPLRCTLTDSAWKKILEHPWTGNIRELLNALDRACLVADSPLIGPEDLLLIQGADGETDFDDLIHDRVLQEYEATGRSVARTSKELGLHRSRVYRHLRRVRILESECITS